MSAQIETQPANEISAWKYKISMGDFGLHPFQ